MTKYIFDVTSSFHHFRKIKPRHVIILCHGYGGDGKDISVLSQLPGEDFYQMLYFYVQMLQKFVQ